MPIQPPTLNQLTGLADTANSAAGDVGNYAQQGIGIQDRIKQRAQQILDSKLNLVDQRNKAEDYFFSLQGGTNGATGVAGSDTARVGSFGQQFSGGAIINPAHTLNAQSSLLDQAYGNIRNVVQEQAQRSATVSDIAQTGANEFNKRLQGLQNIAEAATREYQKASEFYKLQQDKEQADREYNLRLKEFNTNTAFEAAKTFGGQTTFSVDDNGNPVETSTGPSGQDIFTGMQKGLSLSQITGLTAPKGERGDYLLNLPDGALEKSRLAETTNKNGGKECAEYVNDITGAGLGSTYESKKKVANLQTGTVGSVAVWQPSSVPTQYGHTGIIVGEDGDSWIIKSSNYHGDGKISTDKIPKSKIDGYTPPKLKISPQYANAQQVGNAQSTGGEFSAEDFALAKKQGPQQAQAYLDGLKGAQPTQSPAAPAQAPAQSQYTPEEIAYLKTATSKEEYNKIRQEIAKSKLDNSASSKPATEGEKLAAGFAERMTNAELILSKAGTDALPTAGTSFLGGLPFIGEYAQRKAMSPEQQKFKQAADDWIRSKLRKESGATIGKDEMQQEYTTYFPQPGDSADVIQQKAQARQTATQNMIFSAGGAFAERAGQTPVDTSNMRSPAEEQEYQALLAQK